MLLSLVWKFNFCTKLQNEIKISAIRQIKLLFSNSSILYTNFLKKLPIFNDEHEKNAAAPDLCNHDGDKNRELLCSCLNK